MLERKVNVYRKKSDVMAAVNIILEHYITLQHMPLVMRQTL